MNSKWEKYFLHNYTPQTIITTNHTSCKLRECCISITNGAKVCQHDVSTRHETSVKWVAEIWHPVCLTETCWRVTSCVTRCYAAEKKRPIIDPQGSSGLVPWHVSVLPRVTDLICQWCVGLNLQLKLRRSADWIKKFTIGRIREDTCVT